MEPFSMVALGLGALNAGFDFLGGMDRADKIKKETEEMVRRFTIQGQKTVGQATALGAASGVDSESASLTKYLTDMSAEFQRETDWLRSSGEAQADAAKMSGMFQGFGQLGSSLFSFGSANNWFKE
jgi:hypothetical protein